MLELSWPEFDEAVAFLARQCASLEIPGVCGVPRGGLPLAVALSHGLRRPLLTEPRPGCLIVDDVFETGATLTSIVTPDCHFAVWVTKNPQDWVLHARHVDKDTWVVFPWENRVDAERDRDAYHASR
jgi:hypoxanthine phosphoribosyltransferase